MSERTVFRSLLGAGLALVLAIYAIALRPDNGGPAKAKPADPYARLEWHDRSRLLPEEGFTAPDGSRITLASFKGRAVLLNLWASWCQPCIEEMPALSRLERDLGGKDFAVVTVSLDLKPEDGRQWLAVNHIANLGYYSDPKGKLFDALKAEGLPTSIFIDAEGREAARVSGTLPWDEKDARMLVTKLGGAPAPPQP